MLTNSWRCLLVVLLGLISTTSAQSLTERGLANVEACSQLLGYVRFFHPSDEAASLDWDGFAVAALAAVEDADDDEVLAQRLSQLFEPVAPTLRVAPTDRRSSIEAPLTLGTGDRVRAWRHLGVNVDGDNRQVYRSERSHRLPRLARDLPQPGALFIADLAGGVSASFPVSLWSDGERTLPASDPVPTPVSAAASDPAQRAVRFAAVAEMWATLQHFYPYFDVVEADWSQALGLALQDAATDADGNEFLDTLRCLLARVEDGHGSVFWAAPDAATEYAMLPLAWDLVEGVLVVTSVDADGVGEADVTVGDVVTTIAGVDALDALAVEMERTSASTPQFREHSALRWMLSGPNGAVELGLRREGRDPFSVLVERQRRPQVVEPRPDPVAELEGGVVYVDISRLDDDAFRAARAQMAAAAGVVFDFRGYPRQLSPSVIFGGVVTEPRPSATWKVPVQSWPDRTEVTFQTSSWDVVPEGDPITGRKVFLIDGRAISYAESCMGIVEAFDLGTIVGEATAGTNGNVNPISLPGNYRFSFTGMRVDKHDGSVLHGVGILPDVPVERTLRGVREGRDELLERAVEIARGG